MFFWKEIWQFFFYESYLLEKEIYFLSNFNNVIEWDMNILFLYG